MEFMEILSNFGFPVFAFCIAGIGCKYIYDKESEKSQKETEASRTERREIEERYDALATAINTNTESLNQCVKILTKLVEEKNNG